jgi:hypothetical protein
MRGAAQVQRALENCGDQGDRAARKGRATNARRPMGPGSLARTPGPSRRREGPQKEEEGQGQKEVNLKIKLYQLSLLGKKVNTARVVSSLISHSHWASGFMAGKSITSLMLLVSVSSIVRRSIPMPHPAVGGSPYSSTLTKSSSTNYASSSPYFLASAWPWNASICTLGSFSSV